MGSVKQRMASQIIPIKRGKHDARTIVFLKRTDWNKGEGFICMNGKVEVRIYKTLCVFNKKSF